MKNIIIIFAAVMSFALASCEIDNYDAPEAFLTGTVHYDGTPVGVRTNGAQFELWQDGYALNEKIAVHIAQDGTYSARLFSGEYKLVRLAGAPWEAQSSDTMRINVSGNTVQDVEVTPFFIIRDQKVERFGNVIIAEFIVDKVVEEANLTDVKFYIRKSVLLDENYKDYAKSVDVSTVELGQKVTITATMPSALAAESVLYTRIGVRSDQSTEFYYTQVEKIEGGDGLMNPTADFTATIDGMNVTFTNNSEFGVSYLWDFGDGETSTEESPMHTYATDGEYTITLSVTGDEGTIPAEVTQTINVGYTQVEVENGDMQLPGTGRVRDWADVPGWSSDAATTDSGVEEGGWYMPADDNDYAGVLFTGDGAAFNLTSHTITEGETFKVNLKGINAWNGSTLRVSIYYNNGDGVRNVIQTESFTVVDGVYNTFEMLATASAEATGALVGIEVSNVSDDGGDGWTGFDDVTLFVK